MKIISLPIIILVFVSASLTGWHLLTQRGGYVVGGEYVIRNGEVVSGNLEALFAQVTLEEGARVEGRIVSFSSALDLAGTVRGGILAIGSDITVREAAQLVKSSRRLGRLPYVLLLPQMARVGVVSAR